MKALEKYRAQVHKFADDGDPVMESQLKKRYSGENIRAIPILPSEDLRDAEGKLKFIAGLMPAGSAVR